jgi:hypothetical protein
MIILKMFFAAVAGLVMHALFFKPTRAFGPRWGLMLRYAIGEIGTMPFRAWIREDLHTLNAHPRVQSVVGDLLADVGFGSGVLFGHLTERVIDDHQDKDYE